MEAETIELEAISAISGTSTAPFAQVVVTLTTRIRHKVLELRLSHGWISTKSIT